MVECRTNLGRDPFSGVDPPFVPTPTHAEAVARLVHVIETGCRLADLRGAGGLGKSVVLSKALEQARSPWRRIARVGGPADGASLFAGLAEALGARPGPEPSRSAAWKALADTVRLCRWQGLAVVLAVDDCQDLDSPADRNDLERLAHIDPDPAARLTLIRVGRDEEPSAPPDPWNLAIRLAPLTRSEAHAYLHAKLAAAGREGPTFTPKAVTRLHALTGGVPRGLDRLASLALLVGAARGLEAIGPEVVEGVAGECVGANSVTWPN